VLVVDSVYNVPETCGEGAVCSQISLNIRLQRATSGLTPECVPLRVS